MRNTIIAAAVLAAGLPLLAAPAQASVCAVSDVSLTIGSTTYTPPSCADSISNGNPTQETANLNAAFGTTFSYLDKNGDNAQPTFQGIKFSVTAPTNTSTGTWTVAWTDTNGGAPRNLPITIDFEVGLFGGSTGAGYRLNSVFLPISPANGSGTFDITFNNNGGQNPNLSHLTLTGGNAIDPPSDPIPEPASLLLLGSGLLGIGVMRRFRG